MPDLSRYTQTLSTLLDEHHVQELDHDFAFEPPILAVRRGDFMEVERWLDREVYKMAMLWKKDQLESKARMVFYGLLVHCLKHGLINEAVRFLGHDYASAFEHFANGFKDHWKEGDTKGWTRALDHAEQYRDMRLRIDHPRPRPFCLLRQKDTATVFLYRVLPEVREQIDPADLIKLLLGQPLGGLHGSDAILIETDEAGADPNRCVEMIYPQHCDHIHDLLSKHLPIRDRKTMVCRLQKPRGLLGEKKLPMTVYALKDGSFVLHQIEKRDWQRGRVDDVEENHVVRIFWHEHELREHVEETCQKQKLGVDPIAKLHEFLSQDHLVRLARRPELHPKRLRQHIEHRRMMRTGGGGGDYPSEAFDELKDELRDRDWDGPM